MSAGSNNNMTNITAFKVLGQSLLRVRKISKKTEGRQSSRAETSRQDMNSDSLNRGNSNQPEEVKQVDVRPGSTQTVFQEYAFLSEIWTKCFQWRTNFHMTAKSTEATVPYCQLGGVCVSSQGGGAVWGKGSLSRWPFRPTSRIEPRPTGYLCPEHTHKVTLRPPYM